MLAQKIDWLRKSQKQFPVADSDRAGSLGEQIAFEQLKGILGKLHQKARIFQSLRVPKHRAAGKYEIDLLLVSPSGILLIEVKHWGGHLSQEADTWMQERSHEKKLLPDPLKLNDEKVSALRQWLIQRGFQLGPQTLRSLVLFTNPRVSFSAGLKKQDAIVKVDSLLEKAVVACGQPKRRFWQKTPDQAFDYKALIQALEELPTWDRLQLHGGRILHGDLQYIVLPSAKSSAMQRKYLQSALVVMSRRLFPGLFLQAKLQVRDWSGKSKVYPLHPDAKLVFRQAGQNEKEEFLWVNVESLHLGWKDQSYYQE